MDNRDYVWECDYGEHSRYLNAIAGLVDTQNPHELGMCALFVNNNPYNLEFFIVLSYESPKPEQIERMLEVMMEVGARQRPDIPFSELMTELGGRRYNSMMILDSSTLEQARVGLFQFKERDEIAKVISMKPLGKSIPVFLSHSSVDKPFVEDVIPYLTSKGLPVWYDNISIDYGEGILSAVQSGVKDAGAVIFFITKTFLESSWCKLEMEGFLGRYAGGGKVLLLTVVENNIPHDRLPFFLQGIKYLRLNPEQSPRDVAAELMPALKKHFQL